MRICGPTHRYQMCPYDIKIVEIRGQGFQKHPHGLQHHKKWARASRVNTNNILLEHLVFHTDVMVVEAPDLG